MSHEKRISIRLHWCKVRDRGGTVRDVVFIVHLICLCSKSMISVFLFDILSFGLFAFYFSR